MLLLISLAILPLLSAPVAGRSQGGSLTTLLQVLKNKDHTKVIMANASWCFANVFVAGLFGVYAVRVLNIDFITLMIRRERPETSARRVCAGVFPYRLQDRLEDLPFQYLCAVRPAGTIVVFLWTPKWILDRADLSGAEYSAHVRYPMGNAAAASRNQLMPRCEACISQHIP